MGGNDSNRRIDDGLADRNDEKSRWPVVDVGKIRLEGLGEHRGIDGVELAYTMFAPERGRDLDASEL